MAPPQMRSLDEVMHAIILDTALTLGACVVIAMTFYAGYLLRSITPERKQP